MHTDATVDDRVEVRLDRAFLDQHVSGRCVYLGRELSHRGEHPTRNAGEQLDAVQSGYAVDDTERVRRR